MQTWPRVLPSSSTQLSTSVVSHLRGSASLSAAFGKDRRMPITNRFREGRSPSDSGAQNVSRRQAGG